MGLHALVCAWLHRLGVRLIPLHSNSQRSQFYQNLSNALLKITAKADALRLVLKRAKVDAPRASARAALDAHAAALRATAALPVLTAAVPAKVAAAARQA
eukprot:4024664-Pleurochrysis_carterae.AAC.1